MTIHFHKNDLPADVSFGDRVAIDTETMGLNPLRDRLCLIQLSDGKGDAHLVQMAAGQYDAPNLKALLADEKVLKLFHFARFDIATLYKHIGVMTNPVFCTKIASKLVRTYTDRHGLKDLCREMASIDLSKQQQSSDWGAKTLSQEQQEYAASDVLYLHELHDKMVERLAREGRTDFAQSCFDFLPTRAKLDLGGWDDMDIFHH